MESYLTGSAFILFGLLVLLDPKFYWPRFDMVFDFSGVQYPLVFVLAITGIAMITLEWRKKKTPKN